MKSLLNITPCSLAFAICLTISSNGYAQQPNIDDLDADQDGSVTVVEFKKYAESKLPGFEKTDDFVKQVDADSDGTISDEEFSGRMAILQAMTQGAESDPSASESEKPSEEMKESKPNTEKATDSSPKQAYQKIKELVSKSKLAEASKLMTTAGQESFCVDQVTMAIGMSQAQSSIPDFIPGVKESFEELDAVLEKQGLADIDVELGSSEDQAETENEDKKEIEQIQESTKKEILKVIDQNGERWKVITEVWNALNETPLCISPMTGTIKNVEIEDAQAWLTVELGKPINDANPGVSIQVQAPPMVLRFVLKDKQWKFDGLDAERTSEQMEEFMEDHQLEEDSASDDDTEF